VWQFDFVEVTLYQAQLVLGCVTVLRRASVFYWFLDCPRIWDSNVFGAIVVQHNQSLVA